MSINASPGPGLCWLQAPMSKRRQCPCACKAWSSQRNLGTSPARAPGPSQRPLWGIPVGQRGLHLTLCHNAVKLKQPAIILGRPCSGLERVDNTTASKMAREISLHREQQVTSPNPRALQPFIKETSHNATIISDSQEATTAAVLFHSLLTRFPFDKHSA